MGALHGGARHPAHTPTLHVRRRPPFLHYGPTTTTVWLTWVRTHDDGKRDNANVMIHDVQAVVSLIGRLFH
jgi:hypothetical protein